MKKILKARRVLFFILLFLMVLIPGIWIAIRNTEQINQLKAQGKDYNIGFATISPKNGESAYDIAKRNGFKGTESEWLLSLVGIAGESIQGEPGLNAYQLAVVNGYTGSQEEWLVSLKGEEGDSVKGNDGLTPPCYFEASQCRGANGVAIKGDKGVDGQPPVSWRFTYLAVEYECKRTDPFVAANPTYTCDEYVPPVEPASEGGE